MIDLDDPAAVDAADPSGILRAILGFGDQCRRGYELGHGVPTLPDAAGLHSIVLCGMGGSGVGGDVIRAVYRDRLPFPVEVVKDVVLPEHCSPATLVVCSSFSGNTAETLGCFDQAMARGCRTVAVCAGGELRARAEAAGVPVLAIPQGPPAPRTALGLLLFSTLGAFEAMGIVPALGDEVVAVAASLDDVATSLGPARPEPENEAKTVARWLGHRVPVVWGAEGIGAVAAIRWRTELNENAKTPAFAASLPELDHHEIVGWGDGGPRSGERFALVALRHSEEPPDVAARFPASMEVAREGGLEAREVWARGGSPLARVLSLVVLGGATSVYLGIGRGFDPAPIRAIDRLKRVLAEREP